MSFIPPVMADRVNSQFAERPEVWSGLNAVVRETGSAPNSIHALVTSTDWMIANGFDKKPLFYGLYGNGITSELDNTACCEKRLKADTHGYHRFSNAENHLIFRSINQSSVGRRGHNCKIFSTCHKVVDDPEAERFWMLVFEACRSGAIYNTTSLGSDEFNPSMAFPHIPPSFLHKQSMTGCVPAVMPHLDRLIALDLECHKMSHYTETVQSTTLARGFRTIRSTYDEKMVSTFAMDWWNDKRAQATMPATKRSGVMLNISSVIAGKLREIPVAVDGATVWDRFEHGKGGTEDAMGACEIARLLLSSSGRNSSPEDFHVLCKQLSTWLHECSSPKQMGDILVGIGRRMEEIGSTNGPITGPSKHLQTVKPKALAAMKRDREAEAEFAKMEVLPLAKT